MNLAPNHEHQAGAAPALTLPDIGISTNIFNNPADVVGYVSMLGEHFHTVELELAEEARETVLETTPEGYRATVQGLRKVVADKGLDLHVHAPWFGPYTNLAAADEDQRKGSIELLRQSMRFCAEVGCALLTYHPGHRKDLDDAALIANLKASLHELAPEAERLGVTLCLENMGNERPNYLILEPAALLDLCQETGSRLTLDVIHLASLIPVGPSLDDALTLLAPVSRNLHVADMKGLRHRHLPIGVGDLPLTDLLTTLARAGFRGSAIVEEFIRDYTPEFYLEKAVTYRKSLGQS
jgi:sugar phosphate isomerase/epimerase